MMNSQAWKHVVAGIVVASAATGCCSQKGRGTCETFAASPAEMYQPAPASAGVPEQTIQRPGYRLSVGDVLRINYHVKNIPTPGGYRLKIEDVIKLQFPYQPDLNQRLMVGSDGRVRCLLIGELRAAGYTASELEEQVRRGYSRYLKDPELSVIVEEANVKIQALREGMTAGARGVPVKPDGTIDLPYVGEILVAGKTAKEAKRLLDILYIDNDLEEVEVSIQPIEISPRRIFVMGEVAAPGVVQTGEPMSLFQAVIATGGPTARADRSHVVVVRRQYLPVPQAIVMDLDAIMRSAGAGNESGSNGEGFRYDLYLSDGDIVYVPPTKLAEATDWIDQVFTKGIAAVLPYSGNVGLGFGYEIHQAPRTVKLR